MGTVMLGGCAKFQGFGVVNFKARILISEF